MSAMPDGRTFPTGRLKTLILLPLAAVLVAGCAARDGKMMNIRATGSGPDEFAIVPSRPLEMPDSYNTLPDPAPGAVNRADPNPNADAIRALGGNPRVAERGGIPASDRGLLRAASRYGVAPDIRKVLAEEDAAFRREHRGRLLERVFGTTVYFSAYEPLTLDRYAELKRLRSLGIRTPAAPPEDSARTQAITERKKKKRKFLFLPVKG